MVEPDSSPVTILVCADRWGREITLTGVNWVNHVLVRHPELAPLLASVEATLTNPAHVMYDAENENRENVYSSGVLPPPRAHLLLKVCVEFREVEEHNRVTGRVVTAFPIPKIPRREAQKWP